MYDIYYVSNFLKGIYNGLFCFGEWSCYGVSVRGVWL